MQPNDRTLTSRAGGFKFRSLVEITMRTRDDNGTDCSIPSFELIVYMEMGPIIGRRVESQLIQRPEGNGSKTVKRLQLEAFKNE